MNSIKLIQEYNVLRRQLIIQIQIQIQIYKISVFKYKYIFDPIPGTNIE